MKPILNSYDCVDHDPIGSWVPDDPLNVDFWMNFTIGPDDTSGDNFQAHVMTTAQIGRTTSTQYAIILESYSWARLLAEVEKILGQCQGKDWVEISGKLSHFMYWEFQDYRPYRP
jgi:hypothetical protein